MLDLHRVELEHEVWLNRYGDVLPFLSVVIDDLQESDLDIDTRSLYAKNKLAFQCATFVHARFRLWARAAKSSSSHDVGATTAARNEAHPRDTISKDLIHYSLVLTGSRIEFYGCAAILDGNNSWAGCQVWKVHCGSLHGQNQMRQLREMLAQVRDWATGLCAASIKKDLCTVRPRLAART